MLQSFKSSRMGLHKRERVEVFVPLEETSEGKKFRDSHRQITRFCYLKWMTALLIKARSPTNPRIRTVPGSSRERRSSEV